MCKTLSLYFLLMFLCVRCAAQQMDSSYRKYSDTISPTHFDDFYVVQINEAATREFRNMLSLLSVRKLSDSVFIIDKKTFKSFSDRSFIIKSAPANNQWKLSPFQWNAASHLS